MYPIKDGIIPAKEQLTALYADVGWTAYTRDPEKLLRAVKQSLAVYTVWDGDDLIALLRTVGDGESIVYIQDLLVKKACQRRGIGRALLTRVLEDSRHIRQKVLMTDNVPETSAFYRACGLRPAGEYGCAAWCKYD